MVDKMTIANMDRTMLGALLVVRCDIDMRGMGAAHTRSMHSRRRLQASPWWAVRGGQVLRWQLVRSWLSRGIGRATGKGWGCWRRKERLECGGVEALVLSSDSKRHGLAPNASWGRAFGVEGTRVRTSFVSPKQIKNAILHENFYKTNFKPKL